MIIKGQNVFIKLICLVSSRVIKGKNPPKSKYLKNINCDNITVWGGTTIIITTIKNKNLFKGN